MDIQQVKSAVNIVDVIGTAFELSGGGRYLKAKEHDSLVVDSHNQSFYWNSRGVKGDVLSWLTEVEGMAFKDALAVIGGGEAVTPKRPKPPKPPATKRPEPATAPGGISEVVEVCHHVLFSEAGAPARQWLNERGLKDDTLRKFKVGYNPQGQKIAGLWVHDGITIPHFSLGKLWGVKVRTGRQTFKKTGQKYLWLKGSVADSIFNLDAIGPARSVMVVEGEFDCMVGWQEFGDIMPAITIGSASGRVKAWADAYLLSVDKFFVALDNDDAGDKGRVTWIQAVGRRAKMVNYPAGNDLTDFSIAGGDVRAWAVGLVATGPNDTPKPIGEYYCKCGAMAAAYSDDTIQCPGCGGRWVDFADFMVQSFPLPAAVGNETD